MATSGISLLTLQKLMGHADIKTTINIYTHLGLDYVIEDVDKLEYLAKPLIEDMKEKNNLIYLDNYL